MGCYPDKIRGSKDPSDQNQQQHQEQQQQQPQETVKKQQQQQRSGEQKQLQQQQQQQSNSHHNQTLTSNYENGDEKLVAIKVHLDVDVHNKQSVSTAKSKKASENGDTSVNTSLIGLNSSVNGQKAATSKNHQSSVKTILETKPPDPPPPPLSVQGSFKQQAALKMMNANKDTSMNTIKEESKTNESTSSDANKKATTNSSDADLNSSEQRKKIILGKGYSLMDWIRYQIFFNSIRNRK